MDVIQEKDKEIKKLEFLCNHLKVSMQKRDEVSKGYFDELCKVKDENKHLHQKIELLTSELDHLKKSKG